MGHKGTSAAISSMKHLLPVPSFPADPEQQQQGPDTNEEPWMGVLLCCYPTFRLSIVPTWV